MWLKSIGYWLLRDQGFTSFVVIEAQVSTNELLTSVSLVSLCILWSRHIFFCSFLATDQCYNLSYLETRLSWLKNILFSRGINFKHLIWVQNIWICDPRKETNIVAKISPKKEKERIKMIIIRGIKNIKANFFFSSFLCELYSVYYCIVFSCMTTGYFRQVQGLFSGQLPSFFLLSLRWF